MPDNSARAALTPTQRKIFDLVSETDGLSAGQIGAAIYGWRYDDDPSTIEAIVRTMVSHANKRLRRYGLKIVGRPFHGYVIKPRR